ncbi:MAG: efflux RND transporter periplasmic adaptor subunit [Ramlibacter sp.]
MKIKLSWALGVLAVVVAVLVAAAFFRGSDRPAVAASAVPAPQQAGPAAIAFPPGSPQLSMLRSEPASAMAVPLADALAARVAYDEDVTTRLFPPVAGRIVSLPAKAGDRVSSGQVLAVIDAADFGTARADLDKAKADEERKRLAYERARDLGPGEGIAVKDLESARADLDAARAETARAQQRIRNLNPRGLPVQGQQVALTSPMAGVIAERNATPALEVAPGASTPLFVVTDLRHLWVLIDMPERLLGTVKAGARVAVESDAYPGEQFLARITQVGQVVDPNSRRIVAKARIENSDGKLLPEMFVRALVLQDSRQAVRVPNTAIVNRGVFSYVFVETQPGHFERRKVELGLRGADSSFVTSGLAANEKVVTTGGILLDAEMATAQKR